MARSTERVDLGIEFEKTVHSVFSDDISLTSVLGPKTHEERQNETANNEITPDLMFELDGKQFWVDCIYRSSVRYNDTLELYWEDEYKRRMDGYSLSDPLFVAVGVGGSPSSPEFFLYDHYGRFNLRTMNKKQYDRITTHFDIRFILHITRKYFKSIK